MNAFRNSTGKIIISNALKYYISLKCVLIQKSERKYKTVFHVNRNYGILGYSNGSL